MALESLHALLQVGAIRAVLVVPREGHVLQVAHVELEVTQVTGQAQVPLDSARMHGVDALGQAADPVADLRPQLAERLVGLRDAPVEGLHLVPYPAQQLELLVHAACLQPTVLEGDEEGIRALRILEALGGTGAVEAFGRRFFHDSPNWRRAPGKQIKASAGLLGRLSARGLVVKVTRGIYRLSDEGRRYLASRGLPPPPPPSAPAPRSPPTSRSRGSVARSRGPSATTASS